MCKSAHTDEKVWPWGWFLCRWWHPRGSCCQIRWQPLQSVCRVHLHRALQHCIYLAFQLHHQVTEPFLTKLITRQYTWITIQNILISSYDGVYLHMPYLGNTSISSNNGPTMFCLGQVCFLPLTRVCLAYPAFSLWSELFWWYHRYFFMKRLFSLTG